MSKGTRFDRVRLLATGAAMMGMLMVAACDGENLFSPIGPGVGQQPDTLGDTIPPELTIVQPQPGAQNAKPLGDSILVQVNVSDSTGLSRVVFGGIAKRGDPALGTDQVVERFRTKTVTFSPGVQDTTGLRRYLNATADTTRETAFIFVEAFDTLGNRSTDTVQVILGGPDVEVLNLQGTQTRSSGRLNLSILARDPNGVEQIRVDTEGQFETSLVLPVSPVEDSVARDTAIVIPDGVTGQVRLTVTARSALGVLGQAGPFLLNIVSGEPVDTVAPSVAQEIVFQDRVELSDSFTVTVTGADNPEGTGLATLGITVRAFSELGGDTLVLSRQEDFASPQSGSTEFPFRFAPFNVDTASLPERIVFQVSSFAIDASGNCAATTTGDPDRTQECEELPGGQLSAAGAVGASLPTTVVSGRTVELPTGGMILDAVIDTTRRNLFLANQRRNQVEHFDMVLEEFRTPVAVGSQPWGISLNNCYPFSPQTSMTCGDTLIVANSGGTNFDLVWLGPKDGGVPPEIVREKRLLTPDVRVFNASIQESNETGQDEWVLTAASPELSDRPQFLALDSHRRIHFSTKRTQVGRTSIRRIFLPENAEQEEIRLHFSGPSGTAEDSWGILNLDNLSPLGRSPTFTAQDRVVGTLDNIVSATSPALDGALSGDEVIRQVEEEMRGLNSDMRVFGSSFQEGDVVFADTTFVTASGDGEFVAFAEKGDLETARIMLYNADDDSVSAGVQVQDLITNRDASVRGIGLNYDGTMGVARGEQSVYFFSEDLRLQGSDPIDNGGAGAVLHPLHANSFSIPNRNWRYLPNAQLAFVATPRRTIDIYDTFHFRQIGEIAIRDVVTGPLKASLPFPGDNDGLTCPAFQTITDRNMNVIGETLEIFREGDPDTPWPVDGGAGGNEDRCIVLKLYGVTDTGGVVVVDVTKADILKRHPARLN